MRTLGTFRTVAVADLARHRFDGDRERAGRELRRLARHHFVEARTLPGRRGGRAIPVVTLNREGHAFTRQHLSSDVQRYHYGLVRPKEQAHDAALYRMAVNEAERLAKDGATIRRVILDAELKGQLAALRNRSTPAGTAPAPSDARSLTPDDAAARTRATAEAESRTRAAADALHLAVVDGHVQIPDLRIEYETRDGDIARVDLELATEHYRAEQVVAKARAGFTIYAPASQTGRLSAALHDRGLVASILSL